MRSEDFHTWLAGIQDLTPSQHQQALEQLERRPVATEIVATQATAIPACPHCHEEDVIHWGSAHGLARYRCRQCSKTFNALTGTPLARLRLRAAWPRYAQALIEGLSVRKAACVCQVHKDTAFRWRHRFLKQPSRDKPSHLGGIVEADETFFLESFKGSRNLPRPPRKRGGKAVKRGLSAEQIPVLIARDRTSVTTDAVLPRDDTPAIRAVLEPIMDPDSVLCSDGSPVYTALAKQLHLAHRPVNLRAGIRIVGKAFHIQNVNAYDSRLKEWMYRFHGVATHYLPNYLGWRRCLERFSDRLTPEVMLAQAMGYAANT